MHKSVSCIKDPEFINLQPLDLNPLMSACEIKVLYVGENRNRSFISKEVASEMAKTLRGSPIVGWYNEEKEDFMDHGEQIIIDGDGIKFKKLTKPYGFVSPDAKVWFQTFKDYDDFGNTIEREYLMTTGFLWTKQFPECQIVVEDDGRPHSMELDEETLNGHWSKNIKNNMEFFIINDAVFSQLCILGEDVEPCFEGSSVTAPSVSATFTQVDDKFKHTLYSMMQDLKNVLEGGQNMDSNIEEFVQETTAVEVEPGIQAIDAEPAANVEENFVDNSEQNDNNEIQVFTENTENNSDNNDPSPETVETFKKEEDDEDNKDNDDENKDEDEEEKKKYELLENEYNDLNEKFTALQNSYATLESNYNTLVEFKNQVEDKEKDEMINSFYMLSDEDKAEVIENKSKYSVSEIEGKLSVICVRKKVSFDLSSDAEEKPVRTFNLEHGATQVPAWIAACEKTQNNRK